MTAPDQSKGGRSHDEVLAGEYVLGALDADTSRAVEERIRKDRNFAAIVQRWEENLAYFEDDHQIAYSNRHIPSFEVTLGRTSSAGLASGMRSTLWNSAVFWRGVALAGLCTMAVTAVLRFIGAPAEPSAVLVAEMAAKDSAIGLVARYDAATGLMHLSPAASEAGAKRSLELWLTRAGSPAQSLGVLPQSGESTIEVPAELRAMLREDVSLAVSLEPLGGSPGLHATGPILAVGQTRY